MRVYALQKLAFVIISILALAPSHAKAQHYEQKNKSDLRGAFQLVPVVATRVKNDDSIALQGLREYLISATEIDPSMKSRLNLDSPNLTKYPFVYLNLGQNFDFMQTEINQIGKYLNAGGFLILEFDPAAYPGLKKILPNGVRLKPVPSNHKIYSIFYQFDEHLWREHTQSQIGNRSKIIGPSIIGLWKAGKLVGIYSDKGIGKSWITYKRNGREDARMRFGVNLVAYALSQHNKLVTP